MVRTLFIAIAAGSLLTFGLVQSRAASAAEHGHGMHHGDHHAMGEGHHGHDKAKATGAKNGFSKKPAIGTKASRKNNYRFWKQMHQF
jgi:hypothetical protein